MKNSLIFDMDGTLWDSGEGVAESWSEILKEQPDTDNQVITTEDVHSVMGKTMDVIADLLFPYLQPERRYELLKLCCDHENDYLREHGGVLYPELFETLTELKKNYRLFIVSNCQTGYIECFLDHYKFWDLFEDIQCYGNNNKCKGDNIRIICERNGVPLESAAYVGDIQGDYDSSCQAGVGFIHAAYGFGTINADVPELKEFKALPEVAKEYFR